MTATAPRSDDGVVVYRGTRARVLDEAVAALVAVGIPAVASWRSNATHASAGAPSEPGEGEVWVPAGQAQPACAALKAWESASQARVREHLRGLPAQLRRFALLLGLTLLAILSGSWREHPVGMSAFAGVLTLLAAFEVAALRRARRREAPPPRPPAPPTWFSR